MTGAGVGTVFEVVAERLAGGLPLSVTPPEVEAGGGEGGEGGSVAASASAGGPCSSS